MDIEDALKAARPLGRLQIVLLIATSLGYLGTGFTALSSVFLAEVPPHHCTYDNEKYTINESIPLEDGVYSSCKEYVDPLSRNDTQTQKCSIGWDYETDIYGESITSEWDLVCDEDFLPDLSQSILLAGFGFGSIIGGPAADRYGRRPTIIVAVVIFNLIGLAISFSPNYATFVSLRFLLGTVYKAVSIPVTTMLYECILPKHRSSFGNIPPLTATFGLMVMSGLAALVRDWRYFNIVMLTPTIALMMFVWIIPESVRWQVSQGKMEKAEKTMQKIAKFNKAENFPSPVFEVKLENLPRDDGIREDSLNENGMADKNIEAGDIKQKRKKTSVWMLFKPPTLMVTFTLGWFMLTFTLVYFGFALTTGSLAGDPYVNFFLSSLVEIPARVIPLFIVRRTGSLKPLIATFLASGFTMVTIIALKSADAGPGWLLTTLALLGKFFITFSFAPIALLITELFPTVIRNSGTGVAQLIGNIGSLTSPMLLYMDKLVPNISLMTMTFTAFVAAFLCLFLPETLNTTQPETPEDLEVLFQTKRIFKFKRSTDVTRVGESIVSQDVETSSDNKKSSDEGEKKDSLDDGSKISRGMQTESDDEGVTNEGFQDD